MSPPIRRMIKSAAPDAVRHIPHGGGKSTRFSLSGRATRTDDDSRTDVEAYAIHQTMPQDDVPRSGCYDDIQVGFFDTLQRVTTRYYGASATGRDELYYSYAHRVVEIDAAIISMGHAVEGYGDMDDLQFLEFCAEIAGGLGRMARGRDDTLVYLFNMASLQANKRVAEIELESGTLTEH